MFARISKVPYLTKGEKIPGNMLPRLFVGFGDSISLSLQLS